MRGQLDIDFVLLWVDGADPKWQHEFLRYRKQKDHTNTDTSKYRDWGTLRYLFRGIETFTPWVRKIHFVTWGHLPEWLDMSHSKLHIVNHKDFIDRSFLPLFSPNPLEIFMHNIKGLSEKFVYLNDDTFFVRPILPERFFKQNLPCDTLVCNALSSSIGVGHFVLNNLEILNRHFDKRACMKRWFSKWFHPAYGLDNLRNLALLPWPRFTGFIDSHMPQPFLKSTFEELWQKEGDTLEQTMSSRFRTCSDINQYLFRYWQLAKGMFVPVSMKDTAYCEITLQNLESGMIEKMITSGDYTMICLNDHLEMNDEQKFQIAQRKIVEYFEQILPEKSSFEK